jgi:hypothetical protein
MIRKTSVLLALLIVASLTLSACSPPPPLISDKYLNDTSLVSATPCGPPCFQNITIGQTTFSAAVTALKANTLFSNIQSQDSPPQADWATAGGEACCQLTADDKGVVNALLVKLAPNVTTKQLINKYGTPTYVTGVDYSSTEVALALIFPKQGLIAWVSPGDATSTLKETDPVVVALYSDPAHFDDLLATATLQGWNGYLAYQVYRTATPVITPRITATPTG